MIEPLLPVAFLDASVLYPALLRNVLMHFAVADLYQAHWSARVSATADAFRALI